ncbi:MAG TPA: polysaccharide deacetylase family protein [Steroidobacter sp.]|uniref:polysaccharide deacetylase family protein n=1 Tax=Steroidobacter sp. TaxID=1978227 RepID=UPI002ED7CCE7
MSGFGRFVRTLARISRTRYPRFIFGLPLARREIPVFIYHDVETPALARDLEFLRRNNYRTLRLDEYLAAREGGDWPGRSVLLTFDDARKSFREVALPLLRQFDAHAVLFAPSYWMQPARRAADDLFMSWEQLRVCLDSGLVDVQSHAHRHALVATSSQVIDFANPSVLARFDIYDWPMRFVDNADELGKPALGTPVYRAAPLLSAQRRYLENGDVTLACRDFVTSQGGPDFFAQPDWRARLARCFDEQARLAPGRFMDAPAFEKLIASEFELCREEFKRHLGYEPHCIAYPWSLGSALSMQLARHHGFRAAFGVAMDYRSERRRARLPLPVYGRLKSDWLQFLPGEQRASIVSAVRRKVAGFDTVQHLAH